MRPHPAGFSVHESLQARILKWVAMLSSRRSSQPRNQTLISCVSCMASGLYPLNHRGSPFCILVVLKFMQTLLFGAPWSCAALWPLARRADPQLPSSQPPLSSDTHILCAANHRLPTGLSVPTAASSLAFSGQFRLLECLPSWTSLHPVPVLGSSLPPQLDQGCAEGRSCLV